MPQHGRQVVTDRCLAPRMRRHHPEREIRDRLQDHLRARQANLVQPLPPFEPQGVVRSRAGARRFDRPRLVLVRLFRNHASGRRAGSNCLRRGDWNGQAWRRALRRHVLLVPGHSDVRVQDRDAHLSVAEDEQDRAWNSAACDVSDKAEVIHNEEGGDGPAPG